MQLNPPEPSESTRLGPEQRRAALARLRRERFDVVVIGGGVTGCGAALDAAARGLRVALVEQRDLASGTSSRSSKLIHGGLRYLEQRDFGLVWEALGERSLMLDTLAPHLVHPVSFLFPLTRPVWERAYVGAGVGLYDALAFSRGGNPLPRHRHLSRRGALQAFPGLDGGALRGAIRYWDAQVDDARHTLALARTARSYGAAIATSTQVVGIQRSEPSGRVDALLLRDVETNEQFTASVGVVINATATWTDALHKMAGEVSALRVRASKGVHLVVPRDRIAALGNDTGLITRTPHSVLFVIPWKRHWLIGTTDTGWDLDPAHPAANRADIDYLLAQVNRFVRRPLRHDDIHGVYVGLRPLLEGNFGGPNAKPTTALSREHAVLETVPGMITVAGGKYTTYRLMAADAVDAAARSLGWQVMASPTAGIVLQGARSWPDRQLRRDELAGTSGLSPEAVDRLLQRHGDDIDAVLELVAQRPELGEPLAGSDYLQAEVVHAARHEAALHLDDVLTRRTRLSIETADRALAAAVPASELMGDELGWSSSKRSHEVETYRVRVAAERSSQAEPDDAQAAAARQRAPDSRALL